MPLPIPSWLKGALVGLILSLPDALVTKQHEPILGFALVGPCLRFFIQITDDQIDGHKQMHFVLRQNAPEVVFYLNDFWRKKFNSSPYIFPNPVKDKLLFICLTKDRFIKL
jgi:hypothetical protein